MKKFTIYWYIFFILITGIIFFIENYRANIDMEKRREKARAEEIAKTEAAKDSWVVKRVLKKGFEECKQRWKKKQSTKFTDIPSFLSKYDGYEIKPMPANMYSIWRRGELKRTKYIKLSSSCLAVEATPKSNINQWYNSYNYSSTHYDEKYRYRKKFSLPGDRWETINKNELNGYFSCFDQTGSLCSW